jgi:probable HAF family extracellular repeat protein
MLSSLSPPLRGARLFLFVLACAAAAHAQDASFEWIPGEISGTGSSQVNSVSGDGKVVAGTAFITLNGQLMSRHALWRQADGWVALGSLADYAFQHWVWDLSANGSVAVGNGPFVQHGNRQPVMWVGGSATNLPLLSGSNRGDARGISADGSVIVGENRITGLGQRAVRWRGGAPEDLGTLPGASGSHVATAVSADGETVVGTSYGAQVAWRWTEALRMHSLGTPGGTFSAAYDVSADGRVVVGFGYTGASDATSRAFRWTEQAGMEVLPFVGEKTGQANRAKAVSADGDIAVGRASSRGRHLEAG